MSDDCRVGYMCRTSYEIELGDACGGEKVYPSVSELLADHECAHCCGIVKVAVRLLEIVEPGTEE